MKSLIKFIEENLRPERLESVSTEVIDAWKRGDSVTLRSFAEALELSDEYRGKKLFYKLIHQLHPDRFSTIYRDYKTAVETGDENKLRRIVSLLEVRKSAAAVKSERFSYHHTETWTVPDEKGGYEDWDADADVFEHTGEGGGFIDAVKDVIFGNHDFHIEPADLAQIDGGLDLGFCNLDSIDGIEYCRNIRVLNITGNEISNIWDLQELSQLEELYASGNSITDISPLIGLNHLEILDLSDNDIEDIEPLLQMNSLKFVDLRRNPAAGGAVKDMLEENGVIVL